MGPTALLPLRRKVCWVLNPRTWVQKGSTLPLHHRNGLIRVLIKSPTKSNTNLAKPLTINRTVCNMSGTAYQNYKKHSRCIRQSAMSVNSTVQQYVLVNTKVSYPYLSAIPSASFSYYTLRSHIKHTVCLCVSCYYICGEVTHNWYVTFLFHLPLYILCQAVTKM
jgi:hypothetical protein